LAEHLRVVRKVKSMALNRAGLRSGGKHAIAFPGYCYVTSRLDDQRKILMPAARSAAILFFGLGAAILVLFSAYTWLSLNWSYSDGDRAGFVQKFSKRGWICKTWEGELLLATVPGAIPEKFEFSVRDDEVARQLLASIGKRVVLGYAQHKGVPSSCFGDTEYFIEKVQLAQ
jgi:hypothetical protein